MCSGSHETGEPSVKSIIAFGTFCFKFSSVAMVCLNLSSFVITPTLGSNAEVSMNKFLSPIYELNLWNSWLQTM